MASQLYLNSGQLWSPIFFTKFHQFLAVFYLLLIVQLCSADSLNENLVKYADNIPGTDFISDNQARMNDIREVSYILFIDRICFNNKKILDQFSI